MPSRQGESLSTGTCGLLRTCSNQTAQAFSHTWPGCAKGCWAWERRCPKTDQEHSLCLGEKGGNSNREESPKAIQWPSIRTWSKLALQGSPWLTHHIPGTGPGAFHRSLIDGLGFEAGSRWAVSLGQDMLKCQRTIP